LKETVDNLVEKADDSAKEVLNINKKFNKNIRRVSST